MPPTLRPRPVKNIPKLPPRPRKRVKWANVLVEMREMIIKKMEPASRCRFARCSKLSEIEAKRSSNYLHGIGIDRSNQILLLHLNHNPETYMDYCLKFEKFGSKQTLVSYVCTFTDNSLEEQKWENYVAGTPREVRWNYFKYYTNRYKHCIRRLFFTDSEYAEGEYNVKHLKNLVHIQSVTKNIFQRGFLSMDQIINAKIAYLADTDFTFDEIMQLKGSDYTLKSDEFDGEAVRKYLLMRKNGEVHEKVRHLRIWVGREDNRNFDVITQGLDVFNYEKKRDVCRFQFTGKHHQNNKCYIQVLFLAYVVSITTNLDCDCLIR